MMFKKRMTDATINWYCYCDINSQKTPVPSNALAQSLLKFVKNALETCITP